MLTGQPPVRKDLDPVLGPVERVNNYIVDFNFFECLVQKNNEVYKATLAFKTYMLQLRNITL